MNDQMLTACPRASQLPEALAETNLPLFINCRILGVLNAHPKICPGGRCLEDAKPIDLTKEEALDVGDLGRRYWIRQ